MLSLELFYKVNMVITETGQVRDIFKIKVIINLYMLIINKISEF